MRQKIFLWLAAFFALPAYALDGEVFVHDPSTVIFHGGRYYTYGTGNGLPILISDDGWTWRRAGSLMSAVPGGKAGPEVLARGGNNTWAPDVIHIGDQFFVYYSAPGTQPKSAIGLLVGRTLDPQSPDYKWEDRGPVVWSDGIEDSNAIDPGVLLDPDGRLWLTYGSYFGYIRLVELDPKTGQRRYPDRTPVNVAINSEASILIHHDGWYYLLVTHGSCCQGANSTYNIRMGRSRKVTGPYLDNMGVDMIEGGGKLFAASRGRARRTGTLRPARSRRGRAEIFAALRSGSRSRRRERARHPPAAVARRLARGRRQSRRGHLQHRIRAHRHRARARRARISRRRISARRGVRRSGTSAAAHRQATAGATARPARRRPGARAGRGELAAASGVRLAPAMLQAQQKWVIAPVAGAGGYPGAPYFRITIAGTERSLTATAGGELTATAFTGAPEQLWRIDQLIDGTYRISPKSDARLERRTGAVRRRQQHADAVRSSIPPAIASAGCWEPRDENRAVDLLALPGLRRAQRIAQTRKQAAPRPPLDTHAPERRLATRRCARLHSSLARARARARCARPAHRVRGEGGAEARRTARFGGAQPADGAKVTVNGAEHKWHALDTSTTT